MATTNGTNGATNNEATEQPAQPATYSLVDVQAMIDAAIKQTIATVTATMRPVAVKYASDEERKAAKNESSKRCNARKKAAVLADQQELANLRARLAELQAAK